MAWSSEPIKRKRETVLEYQIRLNQHWSAKHSEAMEALRALDSDLHFYSIMILGDQVLKHKREIEDLQTATKMGITEWTEYCRIFRKN